MNETWLKDFVDKLSPWTKLALLFSPVLIFFLVSALLAMLAAIPKAKPTLDRTVLEGYNKCVVAHKEAQSKELVAWYEAQDSSDMVAQIYKPNKTDDNCKAKYGIDYMQDVSDFRIIN